MRWFGDRSYVLIVFDSFSSKEFWIILKNTANTLYKAIKVVYNSITVLSGELAVPCTHNPL